MKRSVANYRNFLRNPHPALKVLFVLIGLGLFAIGSVVLVTAFTPTPDINSFSNRQVSQSTKIYDRTGKTLLYDLNHDQRRNSVPLTSVSLSIQQATISIEDSSFYQHGGVSIPAIIRSFWVDVTTGSLAQGGSTITQQVVKNTLLTNQKSIIRKIQEWVLSWKLEQRYTKDQILELYFNNTPYGGTIYGVEAASRAFFGKSAQDVDLAEAAYLAALPQAPTYYSPYGNNRDALTTRKNLVLDRMEKLGYITKEQHATAKKEVVVFAPQTNNSIIAPHFVFYIEQQLEQTYGPSVVNQGLTVITTLDADLQHVAETKVHDHALTNVKNFRANNAALVALDPKTGQILAMVGSRDYFDASIDGSYNDVLAERQPGSAFKPFVYAAALQKGYTPETAVFDLPTQFSTSCAPQDNFNDTPPCYAPQNFDNKFRGPMTFTTAIAQSINVPAVKALYLAGVNNVVTLATNMGITTLGNPKQYGLSLALGAAEVRLLDITSAYSAFANDGVLNPPTGILSITDPSGKVLTSFKPAPQQVIDSNIAREMSSMLSNNEARAPEYPPDNPFHFPGYDVAAKTGTTNESRDAWTIGYTPTVAVGAWAGNNDNTPMVKEIAGYIVAPMWHDVMQSALQAYPKEFFSEPPAISDSAPPALHGIYNADGTAHDLLYWVQKDNPMIPGPSVGDAQLMYWEYPVSGWAGNTTPSTVAPVTQNTSVSTTTP